MNRKDRNLLAENIRHYLSGTITNFEFLERIDPLYKSNDKAVIQIEKEFWMAYDDFDEHKNTGKHKLNAESENHIKRFILFLKSDNEYEWKDPTFSDTIKKVLNLITFGFYSEITNEENIENGDEKFWPFYRLADFETEIKEPKYLNKRHHNNK